MESKRCATVNVLQFFESGTDVASLLHTHTLTHARLSLSLSLSLSLCRLALAHSQALPASLMFAGHRVKGLAFRSVGLGSATHVHRLGI